MVVRLSRKQKILGSIPSVAFFCMSFLFALFFVHSTFKNATIINTKSTNITLNL